MNGYEQLKTYRRVQTRARQAATSILKEHHPGAVPARVSWSAVGVWVVQYLTGAKGDPVSLTFPMSCLQSVNPYKTYQEWVYNNAVEKTLQEQQRRTARGRYNAKEAILIEEWLATVEWTSEDLKYPKNPGWGEDWADHRAKVSRFNQADKELREYLNSSPVKEVLEDIRNSVPGGL